MVQVWASTLQGLEIFWWVAFVGVSASVVFYAIRRMEKADDALTFMRKSGIL